MTDFKLGYTSKVNEHARAEIGNYLENKWWDLGEWANYNV